MSRPPYNNAIQRLGILEALSAYDPHVAGTPPLGVHTDSSDIDILCCAPYAEVFLDTIVSLYSNHAGFSCWQWVSGDRPLIATFHAEGWEFEIYASPQPVKQQAGWRHFTIEQRLLALGGETFKAKIMSLRSEGYKTEPAFWTALGFACNADGNTSGKAYAGMLELCDEPDEALVDRLKKAGFA
ncbi:DUF4269 domain-containing protein [Agrobacterium sp.]|uniref:DUF4269 domain-containing protein n=1 Tax=Agrobacterium sp. TaxID=361 RepID=UPI0028B100F2|nr:DUF4269 domain-containing protein [Agrobacterium sp.]